MPGQKKRRRIAGANGKHENIEKPEALYFVILTKNPQKDKMNENGLGESIIMRGSCEKSK